MAEAGGGRKVLGLVVLLALLAGGAVLLVVPDAADEQDVDRDGEQSPLPTAQADSTNDVAAAEAEATSGGRPRRRVRGEAPLPRSIGAVLHEVQEEAARNAKEGHDRLEELRKQLAEANARADAAVRRHVNPGADRFFESHHADGSSFRRGWMRNGVRDGLWTERFESGAWIETEYVNGKRHGREAAWHPDVSPRFLGGYADDEMHGTWTAWHANGHILSTREYDRGKLEGWLRTFHENGVLAEESYFADGLESGMNRGWHANGQLAWEMTYVEGKREGLAIWYDEKGALFAEGEYVADELHGTYVEYAPNGSVKRTERWADGRRLAQAR